MDNIVKLNPDQLFTFNSLINKGHTVEAIKYIRSVCGIGLAKAKAECDEYINNRSPSFQVPKIKSELDLMLEKMTPEERRLYWRNTITDGGSDEKS
jgi:hypothetical protein